ncbi:MAG: hypothetical protein L6R39_004507 [Caloplaca ligustica]|nr:MAG: hypothetical protein L6R39_004507 [Caloplaca ligustica]
MDELRIHAQVHSRYQVLDASGRLPFSIDFGLCRRSPADTDPRPVLFDIARSVLDVPYALAHGLLTLHEQDPEDAKQWVEVDLNRLHRVAAKENEWLSLASPLNRTEHWRNAFRVYQCHVDVNDEVASILEPGKKYIIRLASEDLGVKQLVYSDRERFVDNGWKPSHDTQAVKLVNSKPTAGNATFTFVKSLSSPPRVETRMQLCAAFPSSHPAFVNAKVNVSIVLEVAVLNTGSHSITVQTRGYQRFPIPWGPFRAEPDVEDDRMRIIDATPHKPPTSSLQVIDSATGEVVQANEQHGTGPLTDSNADRRPKTKDVLMMKPGAPVIREIDIGALVDGLVDGQYKIRMQPKGCRWWHGDVVEAEGEDGTVPAYLCGIINLPLLLESQDEVEILMKDGKIAQSM